MAEEELGAAALSGLRRGGTPLGGGWRRERGAEGQPLPAGLRARPCSSPLSPARRSPEQKLERKRKVVTPRLGAATWGPAVVRGGAGDARFGPAAGGEGYGSRLPPSLSAGSPSLSPT